MRRLTLTTTALRQLAALGPADRDAVMGALDLLAAGRQDDLAPMRGRADHRVRVGDYRAIVDIDRAEIRVTRIGHRSTVYRP